jgi:cytochrome c-type biogenesis protein CcmE
LIDIEERVADGETVEDVIYQMGSIKEIADEFNESIQSRTKKYKRNRIMKIIGVALVVVLCFFFVILAFTERKKIEDSNIFSKEQVAARNRDIDLLDENNYGKLQENATDEMLPFFNQEDVCAAKQQLGDDWGEKLQLGTIYSQETIQRNEHFATPQVSVMYENISITYTITFDEEMKLAGLYMK